MPSGPVEQQHRVGALCDVARDFVEMELHGLGVGWGQGERRADAAGWANRSEQIGVFVALICGLTRPGSALGPLPDLAILLANAGLVLKTRFRSALSLARRRDGRSACAGSLWNGPPLLPAS